MRPIIINGLWVCQEQIIGFSRYACEILKRMDILLDKSIMDIRIVYPSCAKLRLDNIRNIQCMAVDIGKQHFTSHILRKYVDSNQGIRCEFANATSYNRNGVVCMHDIRALETNKFDKNRNALLLEKWSAKIMNSTIVTVSEYQKKRICREYNLPEGKVFVIPNGWEHMMKIQPDEDVFLRHPKIKMDDYYYSVGTLAKNKNYEWIYEMAKKYESRQFVIAGNMNKDFYGVDDSEWRLPNITFLGYVTDGENKALMQHCRALLHPSKYEGFGIPPLEALSLGKKIIISNATCLPEIYGDSAAYFDPDDYDIDLDDLESKPVNGADEVLEKYTWNKAAKMWLDLFISLQ